MCFAFLELKLNSWLHGTPWLTALQGLMLIMPKTKDCIRSIDPLSPCSGWLQRLAYSPRSASLVWVLQYYQIRCFLSIVGNLLYLATPASKQIVNQTETDFKKICFILKLSAKWWPAARLPHSVWSPRQAKAPYTLITLTKDLSILC